MQSREKIKPIVDVPLVLQMETVAGQESSSQYNGVEYRYNVIWDSRPAIIYLPPEGRDAIVRARPAPGDFIELLKQKRGNQLWFQAQVLGDANEQGYTDEPPPPPAPTRGRNGYANGTPPNGAPRMLAPAPPTGRVPQPNGQYRQATGQAMPPRPDAAGLSPITQQVAGCLRVAFDAWEELRVYAESRGVKIEYSAEDIRATGTSVFIQQRSGGSR